jgi:hypothetical protein
LAFLPSGFVEDVFEAFEAGLPHPFEFIEEFARSAKLVDFAAYELFPPAPVLRDQTGVDQDLDVLLHRGEADRIQPAELADGALTVESLRDDVAPCGIAESEKQPVGLSLSCMQSYNHLVVGLHESRAMSIVQRERCCRGGRPGGVAQGP